VLPALLAGAIGLDAVDRFDIQLLGQRLQHWRRHRQRIVQEGAEVAHRAELHSEAEPVVLSALVRDQTKIGIVQVEIARQVIGDGTPV
jgi:hypothetical protein